MDFNLVGGLADFLYKVGLFGSRRYRVRFFAIHIIIILSAFIALKKAGYGFTGVLIP
jgi:hypothetical protein